MNSRKMKKDFRTAAVLLVLFVLLTVCVRLIDVRPIGPQGSAVGFAALNGAVHKLTGEHMAWYDITDILGKAALLCAAGFGGLGLYQLVTRKDLRKVDADLYVLGAFYVLVIALYAFFEVCIINYRPVLIENELEASYPSSHTMVTIFIMASAVMQFKKRLKPGTLMIAVNVLCILVMAVTVIGRFISGVHWFTDIIGGLLLGSGCVYLYRAVIRYTELRRKNIKKTA